MLEVVFDNSAEGSLKLAQHYGQGPYHAGCIGVIAHKDGREATQAEVDEAFRQTEERERTAWEEAVPLGGSTRDVFGFSLVLGTGDISEPLSVPKRVSSLRGIYRLWEEDTDRWYRKQLSQAEQNLARLLERFQAGEDLRVWYSDKPDDFCGFCWLMGQLSPLKEGCGRIYAVKLPRYEPQGKDVVLSHSGWGDLSPDEWHRYTALTEELAPLLVRHYAHLWAGLRQENAPLRAVVNNLPVSVEADFYDPFIRRAIDGMEEEFSTGQLIGRVLGCYPLGFGDRLIAGRIEAMIEDGTLEIVGDPLPDQPVYQRKLRKRRQ